MTTVWSTAVILAVLSGPAEDGPEGVSLLFKSKPPHAAAGDVVQLSLGLRLPEGWSLLALRQEAGVAFASKLLVEPPAGGKFVDDWSEPKPSPTLWKLLKGKSVGLHQETVVFRRSLRLPEAAVGSVVVSGSARFILREDGSERLAVLPPQTFRTTIEIAPRAVTPVSTMPALKFEVAKKTLPEPLTPPKQALPPEPEPPPVDQPNAQFDVEGVQAPSQPTSFLGDLALYVSIVLGVGAVVAVLSLWISRRGSA